MAFVYILHSAYLDKYYIGSCLDLDERLKQHEDKTFKDAYTAVTNDWILYLSIEELTYEQARNIESHIKRMKSKAYIKNLKFYPQIIERLRQLYL